MFWVGWVFVGFFVKIKLWQLAQIAKNFSVKDCVFPERSCPGRGFFGRFEAFWW